jgi:predicted ATPase
MTSIRTPDQRLRVFVSSTMNELADARGAARRAIEQLHLTPVMFELGARPYPPRDLYLAYLRQSDVFVGIYGESYGWIAPGGTVSGLEDEYLAASDKPKLVYVQSPAPRRDPRLAEMLQRVGRSGLSYRTFGHAKELVRLIGADLALLLSERFGGATEPPGAPTEATGTAAAGRGAAPRDTGDPVRDGRSRLGEANRFIGRHRELAAVRKLLADPQTRLMTLVGPAGIGKTRLALETVAAVASGYEAVATADLDQVTSAPLVTPAIAAALGVPETAGRLLLDSVVGYAGSRRILLVLDNFEHVIDAASAVAQLLARTTRLTVLVTSREPLHLTGERVFEVPPLDLPTWSDGIDAARRSESVQLFVDRAIAGGAHLRLDAAEVHTIVEICRRLDGLPLAIELAASRARMLDLDDLRRRLDTSLATLTGGARDLPARQRTLHSAIAWSYDLLDDPDRRLFGRLGVFAGSFALDAAEAICGDDAVPSVFDAISSLVDKALLRPDHARPGQPRFAMLQVVREYATQRLSATGEVDRLRERHADFYRRLTGEAGARLRHGEMRSVVEQYIADQGNGRAAVQWFLDTGDGDSAARMGLSIWPLLFTQGLLTEGREPMEWALGRVRLTEDNRANARLVLGMMAFGRGDYDRAAAVLQPAYERYVECGDESGVATASVPLGVMAAVRTPGEGEDLLHGAVDRFRRLDDRWGLTFALFALGTVLAIGNREGEAIAPLEEGARVARQIEDDVLLSNGLIGLGWARLRQGEVAAAGRQLGEALDRSVTFGSRETIARALDAAAALAEQTGDAGRGATLFGAAEGVRGTLRADVWGIDRATHAETAQRLRTRLGDEPYERVSSRGATLALDEILHIASGR